MIVNIHEAKTHLSRLLQQVSAGEEVIIANGGRPVARLVPVDAPEKDRAPGGVKGVWMSDDFDAPMSELEAFFE